MISKFDIFSLPFALKFKKKETLQTAAGGILSIFILITGLIYLIYLIYDWYSGNVQPSIISMQQTLQESQLTDLTLYKSPVIITILDYATKIPISQSFLELNSNKFKFTDCSKQYGDQYNGTYCIDLDTDKGTIFPLSAQEYEIIIQKCNGQDYCQPIEIIDEYLIKNEIEVSILIIQQQYDTKNQVINQKKQIEYYYLDPQIFQFPILTISPQIIKVDTGILVFKNQINFYQFPYISKNVSFTDLRSFYAFTTKQTFDLRQIYSELAVHAIYLIIDETVNMQSIQYPKFGTILAAFNSILSVLLVLGFLGRMMSSDEIFNDIQDQMKKYYYNYSKQQIKRKSIFQRLFYYTNKLVCKRKKLEKTQEEIFQSDIKEKTKYYQDASSWIKELIQLRTAVQLLYEPYQWEILKCCKRDAMDYNQPIIDNRIRNHLEILEIQDNQKIDKSNEEQIIENINQLNKQQNSELNKRLLVCLQNVANNNDSIRIQLSCSNSKNILHNNLQTNMMELQLETMRQSFIVQNGLTKSRKRQIK